MIKEESRQVSSNVMEGMTSVSALLAAKAAGVNDRPILEIRFDRAKRAKKAREFSFLERKCKELEIPLSLTDSAELEALCIGNTHGGIVALCGDRTIPAPTAESLPESGFLCLLEGIEDPYNFGYALRSLYAAGCDGILLGERNWMSAAGVVARASAGASEHFPLWMGDPVAAVRTLKEMGYRIVCAGIRDSVGLYEADLKKPLLLVVGGEKRGISAEMLSLADEIVRIDYGRDFRGSLSAASAATVMAFEILRQNS
ncbi:MAG: RNA methyltransferase [Ruminococcaceae bacterium]|nr:RNA methyltransferase [Oscillospiraceae bacterium]